MARPDIIDHNGRLFKRQIEDALDYLDDGIAEVTPTDSVFIVGDGSGWVGESGATVRTSIGLGTSDTPTFDGVTVDTTAPGGIIKGSVDTGSMILTGGAIGVGDGAFIRLYGDNAASVAGDWNLNGNITWDESASLLAFAQGFTVTGKTTTSNLDVGVSGSAGNIGHTQTDQYIIFRGGTSGAAGAEQRLYAGSHATKAGDWEVNGNGTRYVTLDASASTLTFDQGFVVDNIELGSGGPTISVGSGSPESVVTADVGSTFHRTDGGTGTSFYVKESGTGNTGWVAK